jgi:hypothetical protein
LTPLKTCLKCRTRAKRTPRRRNRAKQNEYGRLWRKRNPRADKRNRRDYQRMYRERKRNELIKAQNTIKALNEELRVLRQS